jgi:hypothetical protein
VSLQRTLVKQQKRILMLPLSFCNRLFRRGEFAINRATCPKSGQHGATELLKEWLKIHKLARGPFPHICCIVHSENHYVRIL